jgi:hypothetical protein
MTHYALVIVKLMKRRLCVVTVSKTFQILANFLAMNFTTPDIIEVVSAHKGIKQGIIKKLEKTEKAQSRLCKMQLFNRFAELMPTNLDDITYAGAKQSFASDYMTVKQAFLKSGAFVNWSTKDAKLQEFSCKKTC